MIRMEDLWVRAESIDVIEVNEIKEFNDKKWEVRAYCDLGDFRYKVFDDVGDAMDGANELARKALGEEICL